MEDGYFIVRCPDVRYGHQYKEETVHLAVTDDMHGGGDMLLVEDFVRTMRGVAPTLSSTRLEDSIYGHLLGFAADRSMECRTVMEIPILS